MFSKWQLADTPGKRDSGQMEGNRCPGHQLLLHYSPKLLVTHSHLLRSMVVFLLDETAMKFILSVMRQPVS